MIPLPPKKGKRTIGIKKASKDLPEIDIIVPTHNHLDLTVNCFERLYERTTAPFHLVVVDDSTDETHDYLKSLQAKRGNVTVIHWDEPFKSGNQFFNVALKECRNEYVATVMNSVRVEPDWEKVALQLMKDDPKIGIIGFKSLFPTGRIESAGIFLHGYTPCDKGRDEPAQRYSSVDEPWSLQWAHALLRKKAVVGNLDENLYHGFVGFDDIDNTLVLKKLGWKAVYCGLGSSYHSTHATRGSDSPEKSKHNAENGLIFYERWGLMDLYKADNPMESIKMELAELKEMVMKISQNGHKN